MRVSQSATKTGGHFRRQKKKRSLGNKNSELRFRNVDPGLLMRNSVRGTRKPMCPELKREKTEMCL